MKQEITLKKVSITEKDKLRNILSLYLHDLSKFTDDLDINEEGYFEYDSIDLFFEDDKLVPYFIVNKSEIVGFVLLSLAPYSKPGTEYCIQELFVLNKYRGTGLSHLAIKELMNIHKGKFSIFILKSNKLAINFWNKFYKTNNIPYDENDETHPHYENCVYQIFESK